MGVFISRGMKNKIKLSVSKSFPALLHRNFRYFWVGQCISLIGSWMQTAGQSWLVMQITNSAFLLGIINAAQFIPTLIFSLFAGVIVDKFPKRIVTIVTQIALMMCAFALALLIWTGHAKFIYILIIAIFLGFAQAIDMPARQSLMVELVGKEDLINAIALNSSIFNAARILGPVAAGLIMGWLGAGAAFFINGLSFIAVIYGLYKIKIEEKYNRSASEKGMMSNLMDGVRYMLKTRIIYVTLFLIAITWTFTINFSTLIPVFAMKVLHQGELGYGILMAFMGIGAFVGAVSLATKSSRGPKFNVFLGGGVVVSVFLIALGMQSSFLLSGVLLAIAGWGMITFNASANSILQVNSPDHMRGRIMSAYALVSGGVIPFGSLYAGYMAENFGAGTAFIISGTVGVAAVGIVAILYIKHKASIKTEGI